MNAFEVLTLGAIAASAACASSSVPTTQLARTNAAIQSAEVLGARRVRVAAEHLRLAHEQLERGQRLIADGDYDRAHFVLIRAEADATAAMALANASTARDDAARTLEAVRAARAAAPEGPRS